MIISIGDFCALKTRHGRSVIECLSDRRNIGRDYGIYVSSGERDDGYLSRKRSKSCEIFCDRVCQQQVVQTI